VSDLANWIRPQTMYVDPERPHLGGYHVGGDPLSWCPALWEWLVEELGVRSMLDVGCGEGHALRWFDERGVRVLGVDGVGQNDVRIVTHDYTQGPLAPMFQTAPRSYDLAWCCEFVEHVEERYIPNFLATFRCADLVLMTHAVPGQGGHHHVNCRTDEYWLGVMAAAGFAHERELTLTTRALAPERSYYAWSGLVFRRRF